MEGIYEYRGKLYRVVDTVMSRNSTTGLWEAHYLYHRSNNAREKFTREIKDFDNKFYLIKP